MNATEKMMRGRHDEKIEKLGAEAMENMIVRHAVRCVEGGLLSWDDAMIEAVRILANDNKRLMDRVMAHANLYPATTVIVPDTPAKD